MIDLLLENLGLVIDADGDGKRIRDAILQLAVRGRLVAQEAGADWVTGSFDELGTVNPKVKRDEDDLVAGFLPMANVPDFLGGPIGFERKTWGEIKKGYTRFEEGDLLVAKITPCFQNGKACVARGVPGGVGAGTTELYVFRPHPDLGDVDFFHLLVRTPEFVQGGVDTFTGTAGQQRVAKGYFAGHSWSVPPLAEQHRIVAKVDELMGHAAVVEARHLAASSARVRFRDAALHALAEAEDHEAVKKAWSRIEDHFDDLFTEPEDIQPLRQTILQLAVRGRLVAQEAGDETEAVGLPQGWTLVRLAEVATLRNGRAYKKAELLKEGPCPVLRVGNLFTNKKWYYSDLDLEETKYCERGDLIYAWSASFGPRIWDGPRSIFHYHIWRIDLDENRASKGFMFHWLDWDAQNVKAESGTGSTMIHVSKRSMDAREIPLPPLAEQHRIVAKVDELMALCDTLETSLTRAKTTREQFATSISHALTTQA